MGMAAASSLTPPSNPRVIRGRRVLVNGALRPAALHLEHGRIGRVTAWEDVPPHEAVVEVDGILTPGLIDAHVHVNAPGR